MSKMIKAKGRPLNWNEVSLIGLVFLGLLVVLGMLIGKVSWFFQ